MRKLATVSLSVATTLSLVGGGALLPVAGAQTIAELQAQIAALQAQLEALTGGTSGGCYTFTRDLYDGVSGDDVVALQDYLTGTGHFTFSGGSTGYYGPITTAATAAWQAANGVAPAVGYFGPISRAKYNAVCTPAEGDEDADEDSSELEGGAGSVETWELDSSLNNEDVGEGEEDVLVAGLEIEVDDGSDLLFTAVQLVFDESTTSAADRDFDKYADEVSVWLDDAEVARVDADDFNEDNNWTKTVSFEEEAIIRADGSGTLYVAVSGISNLDSGDEGEAWDVDFNSVRYRDAQGSTISEDPGTGVTRFVFQAFASAANIELKVTRGDDAVNDAHVIDVSSSDETANEPVLAFDIEVEGSSDLEVDDLVVEFGVINDDGDDLDEIVDGIYLYKGDYTDPDNRVKSENIPADDEWTVTFDDLNMDLEAGETYSFYVTVDFLAIAASDEPDEGDQIQADITSTELALWDVEDEEGEDLATADKTGGANGEYHAIYDDGIMVELVSVDAEKTLDGAGAATPVDDQATFEIVFDVTAFGADIYIPFNASQTAMSAGAAYGVSYTLTDGTLTTTPAAALDSDGDNDGSNAFLVEEDTTDTFTLTVTLTATTGTADFARIALEGIGWGTADITTSTNDYGFNLDEFETGRVYMTAQ